jgi:hypothetical protein
MGSPPDPEGDTEDARAQFRIAVGDLCMAAEVGGLIVELLTQSGECTAGVPRWIDRGPRDPWDETGYGRTFRVSDRLVDLNDVVACTIRAPHVQPPPAGRDLGAITAPRDPTSGHPRR